MWPPREVLPVVPVKLVWHILKPEYVDMAKILSDSGSRSTTGQPAGHVVYTVSPAYAMVVASKNPGKAKE